MVYLIEMTGSDEKWDEYGFYARELMRTERKNASWLDWFMFVVDQGEQNE